MFRSPSEPSPFSSTLCPYDTQAFCDRPYCPFAHRRDDDDMGDDVVLVDNAHVTNQAQSSVSALTEIRQENSTDQFSGGYFGYVSTQDPIFALAAVSNNETTAAQHVQLQQHQLQNPQQSFLSNLPPLSHQHQETLSFSTFQPPSIPQYGGPLPSTVFNTCSHQQYVDAIMYPNSSSPLASVSTPQFSPIQLPTEAKHHKRPKPTPGGLPAYIPTPIAQLEKEQREREQRREERRARKEQQQQQTQHMAEKQSDGREKNQHRRDNERRKSVVHEVTANGETRKASTSTDDVIGGLDIGRIMDNQKQLLEEMSDDRGRKMREILRVEAEHERRVHLAKQKSANKTFVPSLKTNANDTMPPPKLPGPKVKKIIEKKKSATPKKKKLSKNGSYGEKVHFKKQKERRTVIKSLIDQMQQQKQEAEKQADEENKKKQTVLNDRVKHVAQLDKEIAKVQNELRHSNNKMAMLDIRKLPAIKATTDSETAGQNLKTNPSKASADKMDQEKRGKIPIWRKDVAEQLSSKSTTFMEDNRFYLSTQRHPIPKALLVPPTDGKPKKSVDLIVKDLFGDDVDEEKTTKEKTKKRKQSVDDGMPAESKKITLTTKRDKNGLKHREDVEDECVRRERQAMVDSIMEEDYSEARHNDGRGEAVQQASLIFSDKKRAITNPSTVPKGGVRKAHVSKFQTATEKPSTSAGAPPSKSLVPLEPLNRKVPLQLRQRHLATIYAEYVKICGDNPTNAIEGAQNEEKSVLERCNGKLGYLAAIPMLIKRLREAAANGQRRQQGETRRNFSSSDSISHNSVLLGRHAKTVTCGLHRADRSTVAQQHSNLSETDFYNMLKSEYLLTEQQLWDNGYPRWAEAVADEDADVIIVEDIEKKYVEIRQSDLDAGKSRIPFVDDSVLSRVCDRCGKEYRLTKEGDYAAGASSDQCIFHWGRAWKKRSAGAIESRYNCCDQPLTVQGCDVAPHHITQTQRLSTLRRYVDTPRAFGIGDPRSKKIYALDCEMVYTVWGPEVARLSVVDITGELILDVIIRPEHRIVDCNTKFSGLKPEQVLAGECDLNEAHQRLFELVNAETILIGHSLESDLRAMRLVHRRVVDTSVVFPHRMGPPFKRALKTLASEITQMIIQDDESGHDSKEDALACMRIMLRKCRAGGGP